MVQRLSSEGLVTPRPGDGTFVAKPVLPPTPMSFGWQSAVLGRSPQIPGGLDHLKVKDLPGVLGLDAGFPDPSLQPHALLAKAAARAAKRPEAWERCLPEGIERLRTVFARQLGPGFTASDVVITPGTQSATDSIMRSFTRPGDSVLMEEPCYPGAIAAGTLAGVNLVPVPTDENGMRTDLVDAIAERSGARLIFVQPRYANPTGTVLAESRRVELLDLARRRGMFIVEDDWVRDLDFENPSPPPLCTLDTGGHVLYLRSLSKVSAPGMRIGAVVARGPAAARLRAMRTITDFFASPLLQCTMLELFDDSGWTRHLQTMRTDLRVRRDLLVDALSRHAPALRFAVPGGGVALWVQLPDGMEESAFVRECGDRGVRVGPGRSYWLSEPPTGYARISFASVPGSALAIAGKRIGGALKALTL